MKKYRHYFLVAFAILIITMCNSKVEAANWVWVTSTDFVTVEIDALNVRKVNGGIYYWDRWTYIDSEERNQYIAASQKAVNDGGRSDIDYSNYRYTVARYYCRKSYDGTIYATLLDMIDYDDNGKVIVETSSSVTGGSKGTYPPGSIGEREYYSALRYAY